MAFAVAYSKKAEAALNGMPAPVAARVVEEVDRLAENPAGLSRPAAWPLSWDGQVYPFAFDHEGARYYVPVVFKYGADEQIMHVESIAVSRMS